MLKGTYEAEAKNQVMTLGEIRDFLNDRRVIELPDTLTVRVRKRRDGGLKALSVSHESETPWFDDEDEPLAIGPGPTTPFADELEHPEATVRAAATSG